MEHITRHSKSNAAQRSYDLFHAVMQAPVSLVYSQEQKWKASRLAMRGAYKWDEFLPRVEDPHHILTFLCHHFHLATRYRENLDEPIQNALRALGYASGPVTIEALKRFDPAEPSFVQGICYVFQDDKPFQLRKAALFFLSLISDRWFNTTHPIMEPDQMRGLCVDWASAIDGIEHTPDVRKAALTVLFGMISSPHWRPHIVPNKWKLLEYFTLVSDGSRSLKRCVDDPELMDALWNAKNSVAVTLWMAILWLKYWELIPRVREQLETATRKIAQCGRRTDLEMCLSKMDKELMDVENASTQYNTWDTNSAAVALRTKINDLQQARTILVALKEGYKEG